MPDLPTPERRGGVAARLERVAASLHDRIAPLRAACASPVRAITFALILTAVAAFFRVAIGDPTPRFITFYPSVALAALLGGPVSGLAATFASATFAVALVRVAGWHTARSPVLDLMSLGNFIVTGVVISLIAAADFSASVRDRRRADRALAESEAFHRTTTEALHEGIVVFSGDGQLIFNNPSAERILGLTRSELESSRRLSTYVLLHSDGRPMTVEEYPSSRILSDGISILDEVVGFVLNGRVISLLLNASAIRGYDGTITAVVVSFTDITERLAVERDLADSRARFASIVANAKGAIVSVDETETIVLFNTAAETMFGYTEAEALGMPLSGLIPERFRAAHHEGFARFAREGVTSRTMGKEFGLFALRRDGSEIPIEASISCVSIAGRPLYTVIHSDLSERVAAERSNARYATLFESTAAVVFTVDAKGLVETWNPAAARLFGYRVDEIVGRRADFLSFPGDPNNGHAVFLRVMAGEQVHEEGIRRHADGSPIDVAWSAAAVRDPVGSLTGVVVVMTDISARKRRERELAERESEQRHTLDAAGLGVWWIDLAAGEIHADARARALLGLAEVTPLAVFADRFLGEDRSLFLSLPGDLEEGADGRSLTLRCRASDGGVLWLRLTARRRLSNAGRPEIWGTFQDITEQKTAEQALQRIEAGRRLEALGRMTGGISHDFNNLLTVISGNLQLLELVTRDATALRWIAEALRATETGGALIGKLSTFARQRRLSPVVVDLNERIGAMLDLVHRSVGPAITVNARFAAAVWPVLVDPSEIENALLNLAFNARDAMPKGGRIVVETANVELDGTPSSDGAAGRSGAFVRLSVCDDGIGMTAEVKARAFEPFFTTKESGLGTGLGLATLHGFVRQSGGFVSLYSEPGQETTVNVYLPRVECDAEDIAHRAGAARELPRGDGRRVLLVEDDDGVARVTLERLTAFGWGVERACDASEALTLFVAGQRWDLVFSDVMMPGGPTGIELARELRALDPGCPILLTSGFSEEIARGGPSASSEFPLLRKPYGLADLLRAVDDAAVSQSRVTSTEKT